MASYMTETLLARVFYPQRNEVKHGSGDQLSVGQQFKQRKWCELLCIKDNVFIGVLESIN